MTVDVTGKRVLRALAVTLCFGAAAVSSPAHAQFFGWNGWDNGGDNGLPGPQVRRSITQQGFRVLGPLRRNGDVFVADVIDRSGRHERLIVGSGDAQILQRFYVDDGRGPGRFVRGDETDGSGGLVPPADIPGLVQPRGERPAPLRRAAGRPGRPAPPFRRPRRAVRPGQWRGRCAFAAQSAADQDGSARSPDRRAGARDARAADADRG